MPTTRHENPLPLFRAFLYFLAFSFLITTSLLVRRALLVLLLSAKILNYGGALDAWKGPVSRETVIHAGIPVDIYRGRNPVSPILIVHGVNPTGKDSLDLVRISQGLAQAGYEVYVPDLADMKKQHLRPEEAGNVKAIFQFIGRNAAIACFSYGCGPALIAATSPEIRDKVRYALDFGGYYDIREMLEFVVMGPETPIAYSKWIYLAANSDLAGDEGQEQIKKIANLRAAGLPKDPALEENLSPGARTLLQIFTATNREEFKAHIDAAPESLQLRLDSLSPSRYVRELRAPLVLIHAAYDPSIPAQQSIELAGAARANGFEPRLTLLQMYGHTHPTLPTLSVGSVIGFYVPETFRFVDVVNHVVASM
jgi:dienelactone hydrolase